MPAPPSGLRSRTSRWTTRSWALHPVHSVGESGPSSSARSHRALRSRRARLGRSDLSTLMARSIRRRPRTVLMSAGGNSLTGRRGSPLARVQAQQGDDGQVVSQTRSTSTRSRRGTSIDGFRVLGVAVRREPWIFTLSTVGSVLFGALTVADAWVLGWSTDHVVLPAFDDGEIGADLMVAVFALFLGVALLRAVGIVARRLGAGVMQYRMQAHTRREVTRQYLALSREWHHRHPTGQLLSNANSDVEAAWGPIAPLPMAVGVLAMMVIAVGQMFFADLVLAIVGLLVFPAVVVANLAYQRLASPLMTKAQQLRAELSEVAHESFDGALVVKTLGREQEETDRFAERARELRDVNVRAGRVRAAFDPVLAALPNV